MFFRFCYCVTDIDVRSTKAFFWVDLISVSPPIRESEREDQGCFFGFVCKIIHFLIKSVFFLKKDRCQLYIMPRVHLLESGSLFHIVDFR